ncbi:MAG TPA: DUF202 domain-containing protein [Thermoanaerobaculia bacterium]|nr:DUF202 domain-containing protein [Thermoanaerobaculia bacterium]
MTAERDPRVYFAAERTLLAWIRTGLAMMGFGFVVARFGLFLRELAMARGETVTNVGGGSLWAGTALVLLGVIVNVHAAIAHRRFAKRFHRGEAEPHDSAFGIIVASVLAVAGFAMAAYLISRG